MTFLCHLNQYSSCWKCRGLPWFLPVWQELRTSISTSTGASLHRCTRPARSAPAPVQTDTCSAPLMRLRRRSSPDQRADILPYLPLAGSSQVGRGSGKSRLMKGRSFRGQRECSCPCPHRVGNCLPCMRSGTSPPLRGRDDLPWQDCMIPGHRTTGTDQSGRVSGLMNLENRRSFRDLPAGTMTVPNLVDMFRADTGSGMRIQFR